MSYIPTLNGGPIRSLNNRLREESFDRGHWNPLLEARVVIGDFKTEHNQRDSGGYRTPAECAAAAGARTSDGLQHQLESETNNPALESAGLK